MASWRNLPSVHPVWKLLYPHTKGIMAINTLGRNELIPAGGAADKVLSIGGGGQVVLMQKHYKSVTFDSYDLVKDLRQRGVDGLRKFHYKDDALLLWNAIHKFVEEIINIYYKDDKSVQKVKYFEACETLSTDPQKGFCILNNLFRIKKFAKMWYL